MRLTNAIAAGALAALLVSAFPAAQEQGDADRKVAGGGVTVKGWTGKADSGNRQGLTIKDSKLAPEGKGYRLMTGPASMFWNPSNAARGDFTVKATFTEAKQTYNHPHPFGVFIGGSELDSDAPNALYCIAYRNGNYVIRGFNSGKRFDVVGKPVTHEAVKKAAGPDDQVVQEVAWRVQGDTVECLVNGTAVWSGKKADVTGPGKLASTDGIVGIRASHNSDAMVTGFELTK